MVELSLTLTSRSASNILAAFDKKLFQNYFAIVTIIYKDQNLMERKGIIGNIFMSVLSFSLLYLCSKLRELDALLGILNLSLSVYRWQNGVQKRF